MKSFTKYLFAYLVIALVTISCSGGDVSPNSGKTCKLTKISNTQNLVSVYTYNSSGKVSTFKITDTSNSLDAINSTTTFTYDQTETLTKRKITYASGKVIEHSFFYDSDGRLEKMKILPGNSEVNFEYYSNGRISRKIESPSQNVTIYTYDAGGNLASIKSLPRVRPNFTYVDLQIFTKYDDKNFLEMSVKDGYPDDPIYQSPNNRLRWEFRTYPDGKIYPVIENIKYNSQNFPISSISEQPDLNMTSSTFEYTDC